MATAELRQNISIVFLSPSSIVFLSPSSIEKRSDHSVLGNRWKFSGCVNTTPCNTIRQYNTVILYQFILKNAIHAVGLTIIHRIDQHRNSWCELIFQLNDKLNKFGHLRTLIQTRHRIRRLSLIIFPRTISPSSASRDCGGTAYGLGSSTCPL